MEGDIDFGPDNVGDNFFDGPLQNDDIVAAKGLIDLFKSPSPQPSSLNFCSVFVILLRVVYGVDK